MSVRRSYFAVDRVQPALERVLRVRPNGFTLIELIVTLAIIGILAAIAIPSFNEAALSSKLNSVSSDFVSSAHLARSEAIKRNATVQLCASSDGETCAGAWNDGWVVLAGGTVVTRQAALPTGFLLSGVTVINFQPTGVGATSAKLTLCRNAPSVGTQKRSITLTATGRPGVEKIVSSTCP